MKTVIRELRIFFGILLGLCLMLSAAGLLYAVIGEWNARRKLAPERRTPEIIRLYDDAVCLDCQIMGGMYFLFGLLLGAGLTLLWSVIETINGLINWASAKKKFGRHRAV